MAATVIPFPDRATHLLTTGNRPAIAEDHQRVLFQGRPYDLRQVYDSRALIAGPLLPGIAPRERIARIEYLSPLPPANG